MTPPMAGNDQALRISCPFEDRLVRRSTGAQNLSVSEAVGTTGPSFSGIVLGTVDNARSVLVWTNRHFAAES